jgi:hypothetical protein
MRNLQADTLGQLANSRSQLSGIQVPQQQLEAIQRSPGWRFVLWIGRMRLHFFPPGSRREVWWLNMVKGIASRLK